MDHTPESKKHDCPQELPHPALSLGYKPAHGFTDLEGRVLNSMKIVAQLIAAEGEKYLPIFQRLEQELADCQKRKSSLHHALFLCENSSDKLSNNNKLENLKS